MLVNHVSWLDIFVINRIAAARFVAKSEIGRWPLIGSLVSGAGTIFIERGRRRAVHQVLTTVADYLSDNELVGIFPEGTTTTGDCLLPFHSNLVQAAIIAKRPVLPVALKYSDEAGGFSEVVTFVGETTFLQSVWRICGTRRLQCDIYVGNPIATDAGASRHMLSQLAKEAISQSLGLSGPDTEPERLRDPAT